MLLYIIAELIVRAGDRVVIYEMSSSITMIYVKPYVLIEPTTAYIHT